MTSSATSLSPIARCFSAAFIACVLFATASFGQIETAHVTGGDLRGVVKAGVGSFKGVPFAAPPVGALRWKPPQPVIPWTGERKADAFGPAAMQAGNPLQGIGAVSEDCLYLNVWTAAKSPDEKRPVMVWIHGGAFQIGSTRLFLYDGSKLAEKGVVLVSVGYRLGVFGFLAHPELSAESGHGSGCYGIQDQLAGLKWVKENIARFGGDPSNVTIFGESAGGESVAMLAASPAAKGLFHRVISESGGAMSALKGSDDDQGIAALTLKYGESKGAQFVAKLGAQDIAAARAISAEDILNAKPDMFWPVADGETIVGDAYELYDRKEFNDTPILVGTNSDDGGMFALRLGPGAFAASARSKLGPASDAIIAQYPHATAAEALKSGRDIMREFIFAWPTWAWALQQSRHGQGKAYVYYFDYSSPKSETGVGHGAEIPYVFQNLTGLLTPSPTPHNLAVSDKISDYWINFARTGDPNGPNLPTWPAFDEIAMNTLIVADTFSVGPIPNLDKLKAMDQFFAWRRGDAKSRR